MKKYFLLIFALSLTFLATVNASAKPPINLSDAKQAVIYYYDSGEYVKDVNKQTSKAKQYLEKRTKNNQDNKKLAIIMNIDDTALFNYPIYKKNDFSRNSYIVKKTWRKKAAPVQPVLDLYNYAKQNNIAIFLITERPTSIRAITIRNLKRAGYRNWDGLYTITATNPKTQAEQDIQRKGYEIILNISDQESDIAKSTAEMKVKLPNYMYVE